MLVCIFLCLWDPQNMNRRNQMYYFIINPASGSGRGLSVWNRIRAELEHLHTEYRFFLLSKRGEAAILARSLSRSAHPCTVVVVGGDGTINEVINGLESFSGITFACIPTGSGNDFVRGLNLEKNPVKALHAILHPQKVRKINIGRTETTSGTYSYAVSSGIGYDASVCDSVQKSTLKKLLNRFRSGKLIYLLTALWQLMTMKRQSFRITADGSRTVTLENAYFAASLNLQYEGGGFRFCPDAQSDDDCIDLIVAYNISRLNALCLLPLALCGKHVGHRGIRIIRCKRAEICCRLPMCVHTDGEIPGYFNRVAFSLHSEKLAVIVE